MKYPTIRIEGAILASDILDKIETGDITGQRPADFKIEGNYKVKDVIARAWADAKDYWRIFKRKREELASDDRRTGTSETRSQWMIPFLSILGYNAEYSRAEEVNGKSYAISHRDRSLDNFPIHIMGFKDELDKKRKDSGPRMSPHALVQEYLNLTEHLFALVTNGLQIRLLRDSSRLIKLSYIEFDLERMMEEEHYADFAILYRLLHYTRMPVSQDTVAESLMEVYHQDSLESGSRIRDGLSEAVKNSILTFSNGFLSHPANEELRNWFEEGNLEEKQKQFFQWQLRLIYRLLFVMVIEERDLIYPKNADKKLKSYYYDFYSLNKLRNLSEKRHLADPRYSDYWQSVKNTFRLFENEQYGKPLGIAPLAGLFEYDQIGLLNDCTLDNKVMMECLRNLSLFKNKQNNQVMRVNYASLNVEEFGSVYEGLLEYKAVVQHKMGKLIFDLVKGDERSSSGSHYTPDELVQPLIKHSLDYIIADKLKEENPEQALLSITVCDVACGSGHILLNAARRIATELAIVRTGEDQPAPSALRHAIRDVIKHCIYGVDLNPLAVELTKVALWMEAHNPNEPLNFLDHHIKCGNAIVGLAHRDELENGIADEAFKTLPGDDKEIAAAFRNKNKAERKERTTSVTQVHADFEEATTANVQEAMAEYEVFKKMPEKTPAEIEAKQKAYNKFLDGKGYMFLKTMCDTQVAQFFIPKTEANKDKLVTDNEFRQMIQGYKGWTGVKTAKATAVGLEKRFFHWFLEFPEIFNNGGFDCILGNPPYLGGKKISSQYGKNFLNFLKVYFHPAEGGVDLVAYFLRRIYFIISNRAILSVITSQIIKEADTRRGGLNIILKKGGKINFVKTRIKWPGTANIIVDLFAINKNLLIKEISLNGKLVKEINDFFEANNLEKEPFKFHFNSSNCFQGCVVSGSGFMVSFSESNSKNLNPEVVWPFLIGNDINTRSDQKPSRKIIFFRDWPLEKAELYPIELSIVKERVKPERDLVKRKLYRENWWQFAEKAKNLYKKINSLERWFVISKSSKYNHFSCQNDKKIIYDQSLTVITLSDWNIFLLLESEIHSQWATKYCSSQGGSSRYNPNDAFHNFPLPPNIFMEEKYRTLGEELSIFRKNLMLEFEVGMTKVYNYYHSSNIQSENLDELTVSIFNLNAFAEKIEDLRNIHNKIDFAVLDLYGWNEDSEKWGPAIDLAHDFYEVDYLPENDNIRYTISPEARKEVLKRLLLLNHERYEEEIRQGLHKKKDVIAFYKQKGKEVPEGTVFSDAKGKAKVKRQKAKVNKVNRVNEPETGYSQMDLFGETAPEVKNEIVVQEGSKVIIKNQESREFKYHLLKTTQKGNFTGDYKHISTDSNLALAMIGKKVGDGFAFGGVEYVVVEVG